MNDYRDLDPYPWKDTERDNCQTKFKDEWNNAIISEKSSIIHAPTGIGKTVCSLTPAIYYAIKNKKLVVILVNRVSQHEMFIKELKKIDNKSKNIFHKKIIVADIVGKSKLCFANKKLKKDKKIKNIYKYCKKCKDELKDKTGDGCEYLNNLNFVKFELLNTLKQNILSYLEVESICGDACPYELLSLHIKRDVDVIIMDYNHIFTPFMREIFLEKTKRDISDIILIADEAHNIPDIARRMLSKIIYSNKISKRINGSLSKSAAWESNKYIDNMIVYNNDEIIVDDKIRHNRDKLKCIIFENLTRNFVEIKDKLDKYIFESIEKRKKERKGLKNATEGRINKKEIISIFEDVFSGNIKDIIHDLKIIDSLFLYKSNDNKENDDEDSYIIQIHDFLVEWIDLDDKIYLLYCSKDMFGYKLQYSCLDPKKITNILKKTHSTLIMSGTLKPTEMFKDVLELGTKFRTLKLLSPFPPENRLNIISCYATSASEKRKENIEKYVDIIFMLCKVVPKNIGLFFPSFPYMKNIYDCFKKRFDEQNIDSKNFKNIMVEKKAEEWKFGEKEIFTKKYKKESETDNGAVLFGVVRANCSEGVDYPGDCMNAAIIIGIPYSAFNLLAEALIGYYGRDYGYLFPTINVISQAAGRCIRSDKDRGIVMYVDSRYNELKIKKHLPKHEIYKKEQTEDMLLKIKEFYNKN